MNKTVQNVLFKAVIIICHIVSQPNLQRILAVSQNNMNELSLIVYNMTTLDPTQTQSVAMLAKKQQHNN